MYLGVDHLSSSCLGFSALFEPIYLFPSPSYRIFHLLAFQINSLFLYSSLHFKTLIMQIVLLMLSQRQLKLSLFLLILFFYQVCVISRTLSSRLLIHTAMSSDQLLILFSIFLHCYCVLQLWLIPFLYILTLCWISHAIHQFLLQVPWAFSWFYLEFFA